MKKPVKSKDNQNKNKSKKLSRHELIDLMGMNRPTYKRNRGAIRRK
ncbi:hypothetical protein M3676_26765 [Metabacillus litoralis]|nr:hypothetical protein [Metabacillus litoralis]